MGEALSVELLVALKWVKYQKYTTVKTLSCFVLISVSNFQHLTLSVSLVRVQKERSVKAALLDVKPFVSVLLTA